MSLRIASNIDALNTYKNLSATQSRLSSSIEKLSSGYRINNAADDAAGLAISQGLQSQITGSNQAIQNAQDGISMTQTAEGSLSEVQSILQRMRDLTVQASNGTNSDDSKKDIQTEIGQLNSEIGRISGSSNFNGTNLLSAAAGSVVSFQVGAGGSTFNQISISLGSLNVSSFTGMTAVSGLDVTAAAFSPATALSGLDAAIQSVSTARANLGAVQNRFNHTINNLTTTVQNLTASKSRITDTDMASEMMSYSSASVLSQAGTAMLAQANQLPNAVLKLLG